MSLALALTLVGLGYAALFATLIYFYVRARRPVVNPLGSPPCDRCGNDTDKPWLWSRKGTPWHCTECDRWMDSQLFPDVSSPDYDPAQHAMFVRAYAELRRAYRGMTKEPTT
jgi:hypothetical protein